jgi:hypothetical protein
MGSGTMTAVATTTVSEIELGHAIPDAPHVRFDP